MMNRVNYDKHRYTGPKVNLKRSHAQLRQCHGPQAKSRAITWNKENTQNKITDTTEPRTYKPKHRRTALTESGAAQLQKCEDENTVKPQAAVLPIGNGSRPLKKKVDIHWPPPDPSVEDHRLVVEIGHSQDFKGLNGHRIVDIKHLLKWALTIQTEHAKDCTCGLVEYLDESRDGFSSIFTFRCTMCNKVWRESSDPENKLNKSFVWGTLTSASHYSQTSQLMSTMDIPTISPDFFRKTEQQLGEIWEETLLDEMKSAAQQEKEAAIAKGHLCSDGIPYILVYVDGGWSKRSYGHNFNAASGIACIIGAETKKCLYLGVRNKYCSMCAYNTKNNTAKEHVCFKNYEGSSTGMEASILVEGFSRSVEMYGLRYTSFVGDGDSSVFARLKEKVPYGNIIKKMECKNHVAKNYTSSLYKVTEQPPLGSDQYCYTLYIISYSVARSRKHLAVEFEKGKFWERDSRIAGDTKLSLPARKILRAKLTRLTTVARLNMKQGNAEKIRTDLRNGPLHVFGEHTKCEKYYCRWKDAEEKGIEIENDENLVPVMKKDIVTWASIETAVENMARKADRLVRNITNNVAENFMGLMAKFNCGKRINLTKRGSYTRRAHIAGLGQITGQQWQTKAIRKALNKSPGPYFKTFLERSAKSAALRAKMSRKRLFPKKVDQPSKKPDKDYGPKADDPPVELTDAEMDDQCQRKLEELQIKSLEEIDNLERRTVGQHGNTLYDQLRKDRLTASLFGQICKRRKSNSTQNHVKAVLYPAKFHNSDTEYGQTNERTAIAVFERDHSKTVIPSGLFIDIEHGFLGASPDGIVVGESAIVEVKSFPSLARAHRSVEEAAATQKSFPIQIAADGELQLKNNHNFYYQIQGQLAISRRNLCYLLLYVDNFGPLKVIKITRNDQFIQKMKQNLVDFYKTCILPEIILRKIKTTLK